MTRRLRGASDADSRLGFGPNSVPVGAGLSGEADVGCPESASSKSGILTNTRAFCPNANVEGGRLRSKCPSDPPDFGARTPATPPGGDCERPEFRGVRGWVISHGLGCCTFVRHAAEERGANNEMAAATRNLIGQNCGRDPATQIVTSQQFSLSASNGPVLGQFRRRRPLFGEFG